MPHALRPLLRRFTALFFLLIAVHPSLLTADTPQQKAKQAEAKRLSSVAKATEKQGRLVEARQQYLASEHVLFTSDAEEGLSRIAEAAAQQVKTMMADAGRAYAAENFARAAQLLEGAGALHPGKSRDRLQPGVDQIPAGQAR